MRLTLNELRELAPDSLLVAQLLAGKRQIFIRLPQQFDSAPFVSLGKFYRTAQLEQMEILLVLEPVSPDAAELMIVDGVAT